MTRKLAWAGLSFWAGLALSATFRSRYDLVFAAGAAGLAVVAFASLKGHRSRTAVCFVSFICAVALNLAYTKTVYERLVSLDGKTVTVTGTVRDISHVSSDTDRITVRGKVGGIPAEIAFLVPRSEADYYDRVEVTGKVERISNTALFDSEDYYYPKGVFLTGKGRAELTLTGGCAHPLLRGIRRYRDRLFERINEIAPGKEGAFLSAMLCGDKSELTPAMKTASYRSGIGHIFAVSGTHAVIAASLFSGVLSIFIRNRRRVDILTIAEVWAFAVFAGLSVTVVRAAVMVSVTRGGFLFGRKSDTANSLGLCALILTLASPYTAIDPSFVLSFLSVFAIGVLPELIKSRNEEKGSEPGSYAVACACVMFFTAPAAAVFFGGVSVACVLSNILLVPLCTAALQLCLLVVLTGGAGYLSAVLIRSAAWLIKPVLASCSLIAKLPYSYVTASAPALLAVICALALVPVAVGIRYGRRPFAACSAAVVCIWLIAANSLRLSDKRLRIAALPAGKSAVYVVTLGNSALVIDLASTDKSLSAAENVLLDRGCDRLTAAFFLRPVTEGQLEDTLFFEPETVFANEYDGAPDGAVILDEGGSVSVMGAEITYENNGFRLLCDGHEFFLGKSSMTLDNKTYDLSSGEELIGYDLYSGS
ncbi:MAG: ComEC/Rec2 family competence protein [Ruminococcus sp.]|nr:ComEC/Rec2 family competence protein [Ruminococcus sp.]